MPTLNGRYYCKLHYEDVLRDRTIVADAMRCVQEFSSEPRLFRNGTDRFDINQGKAGTCWFLAVLASLAEYPHIIEQV